MTIPMVTVALALAMLPSTSIQPQAPVAGVKGDWMLSFHGDHVMTSGLRLDQDGSKVTGILFMQGKEAEAEGEFVERTLTLTVNGVVNADHSRRSGTTKIEIRATMKDDGTLEGEMTSGRGAIKVTAERFRKQ